MLEHLQTLISLEGAVRWGRALFLVVLGLLLAFIISRLLQRFMHRRMTAHVVQIVRRLVFYSVLGVFIAAAMSELGFSFTVIMGAAGILTVALGFASQTTASNLISGLFLIGEHSFEVGDLIRVGDLTGEVLSIDALSVKLKTFDNLFVRIPNETLIKSQVTTLTRYPIRRIDLALGVAYKEDIERVREILARVADANPLCLDEPAPQFIFTGFGDSSLNIQFSVWVVRENFLELRNAISAEIKTAFDEAGVEIPFPHRTLYAGEATRPFPVPLVEDAPSRDRSAPDSNGQEDL